MRLSYSPRVAQSARRCSQKASSSLSGSSDDAPLYPEPSSTLPYSERAAYNYQPNQKKSILLHSNNPITERSRGKDDRSKPRKTREDDAALDDFTRNRNVDPYRASPTRLDDPV
jgi:hypothetical protein